MKRWLIAAVFLAAAAPASAFWQSRDSNYNQNIPASASYTGPGDVVSGARMWWGLRAYSLATVGTRAANICNAADANCADVNTLSNGDFDVATATGAPLNCDGAGGTCTVKILYDQTGNTNCTAAACDLTAALASRPTLTFNCIGSKPCITYSGSKFLRSSTSATSTSQPITFSGIASTTNTGAARSLLATISGGAMQLGYPTTSDTVQLYAGSNRTATATAGSYHALQAVFNNGSSASDMNVDGTATAGASPGGNAMVGTVSIGDVSGGQFMSGTVLEAGAWGAAFSSGQSSSMSSNQHSYWGF